MVVQHYLAYETQEPDPVAASGVAACGFDIVIFRPGHPTVAAGMFPTAESANGADQRARSVLDSESVYKLVDDPSSVFTATAKGILDLTPLMPDDPEGAAATHPDAGETDGGNGRAAPTGAPHEEPEGEGGDGGDRWGDSRECGLLALMDPDERRRAATLLLDVAAEDVELRRRAKEGALARTTDFHTTRLLFEMERATLARHLTSAAAETVRHMERWRELSGAALKLLFGSVLFSAVMVLLVVLQLGKDDVDPWAGVALIFVLALFAVSPAVLLLLQRPLAGLDKFSPGGPAEPKEPAAGEDAPAADEPDGKATDATSTKTLKGATKQAKKLGKRKAGTSSRAAER